MNMAALTADSWQLDKTDVHLWSAQLNAQPATVERWRQSLSADEQRRADRFHEPADRQRYIAARAMLRFLLSCYLKVEVAKLNFAYSHFGKPRLADDFRASRIDFNVSHSGDLALYGLTRERRIGVDLERVRPEAANDATLRTVLCDEEFKILASLPRAEQIESFFRCWTRKEAFLKARGEGLSYPLQQVEVTLTADGPARILRAGEEMDVSRRWSLCSVMPGHGYVGAAAAEGTNLRFELRELSLAIADELHD